MRHRKTVHIHHPGLGAVSEVDLSSLRVWQKAGWQPVDPELRSVEELAEAVVPEPEPQYIELYGEMVLVGEEPSAEVQAPEWTDSGASEVDEAALAEDEES